MTFFSLPAQATAPSLQGRAGGGSLYEGEQGGGLSLAAALAALSNAQSDYTILFIHDEIEHLRVNAVVKDKRVPQAVRQLCKGQPVKVKVRDKQIFVQYMPEKDYSEKTVVLQGRMQDAFLKIPLPDVKVSIHRMDSTIVLDSVDYSIAVGGDMKPIYAGFYAKVKVGSGEYLVHGQLDGYDDAWNKVTITDPKEDRAEAGVLEMRRSRTTTMKEVTVTATRIKMYYRGDTLVYDATAFQMPDGSMLDDLIRQLPDVTMNNSGEIFVKGRKVDELLLGSRSFFGGNKRVLMENLPYYTVKLLKVYEKQTDKSVALGYDVEPRQFVMDVILKDEYKQGYIGNVEAAGGRSLSTDPEGVAPLSPPEGGTAPLEASTEGIEAPSGAVGRATTSGAVGGDVPYLARAFLLGYADNLRFTLLGNVNNVNESNHLWQTGHWTPDSRPRSLLTTRSVKAEIDYHTNEDKLQETFSAEFTSSTEEQAMQKHYEQFLEGCRPTSLTASSNRTGKRELSLTNSLSLKKPFWVEIRASFTHAHRDGSFHSAFDQWNESLTASQRSVGMSEGTAWSGGASVNTAFNIGHTKQHINVYATAQHEYDQSERASQYATQDLRQTTVQHNADDISNRKTSGTGQLSYEKELGHHVKLSVKEVVKLSDQLAHDYLYHPDTLAMASQLDALAAITDPSNSYDSHHRVTENTLEVQLHQPAFRSLFNEGEPLGESYEKFSVKVEAPMRHESLRYQRGSLDTLARQNNLLFNLSGSYGFTVGSDLRLFSISAHHTQRSASLMDRITYRDDSQPLVVKLGNPDLSGSAETGVWAHYVNGYAGFHRRTLYVSGGINYQHRDVAQSVNYNPATSVYTYQPMNVSGAYRASTDFQFNQYFDEQRRWMWHTDADASFNYAKDHAMLAGETESHENSVNTLTLHDGAYLQYRRKQLELRATGDIAWRHSEGRMYDFSTLNALDFHYGFTAKYTTPALWGTKIGGLTIAADGTMYSRRGYGSNDLNTNDFVLNATLSQPFAKGKFILRLEGFDLLNQLSPIDYTVNAQGRTETWYRSLPHYLMLHAQWHFNKNPKKK